MCLPNNVSEYNAVFGEDTPRETVTYYDVKIIVDMWEAFEQTTEDSVLFSAKIPTTDATEDEAFAFLMREFYRTFKKENYFDETHGNQFTVWRKGESQAKLSGYFNDFANRPECLAIVHKSHHQEFLFGVLEQKVATFIKPNSQKVAAFSLEETKLFFGK